MPRRATPHPIASKVGARIRTLRQERGLSIAKLGAASRVSKGSLSGIERGLVIVNVATLARIARGLGTTSAHMMTFPEDSPLEALLDEVADTPKKKPSA
jgi:transcriptional regulator with XRE-family HTH domain